MRKIIIILLLLPQIGFAQEKERISFQEVLEKMVSSSKSHIVIRNATIYDTRIGGNEDEDLIKCPAYQFLMKNYESEIELDQNGYININKSLSLIDCDVADDQFDELYFKKIILDSLRLIRSDINILRLDSIKVNSIELDGFAAKGRGGIYTGMKLRQIIIGNSIISRNFSFANFEANISWIQNNRFNGPISMGADFETGLEFNYNSSIGDSGQLTRKPLEWASIVPKPDSNYFEFTTWGQFGNFMDFSVNTLPNYQVIFESGGEELEISENIFGQLTLVSEARKIDMVENDFIYGFTPGFSFSEKEVSVEWDQFKNRVTILLDNYYHPANRQILLNPGVHKLASRFYNNLSVIYKENGNIEDSNETTIMFKELELERLRLLNEERSNFNTFFRLKLAQLLKTYVDHGTNPAKAIVISMYVILGFAVFYFFFPSEWDSTSKRKLIQNYRDFIQKNDKGYFRPFMMMVFGFGVSMINAITLSLNSFTTLGFGRIPTKGIARYVCIMQGFIGWFLLSIFTVALINQVLA